MRAGGHDEDAAEFWRVDPQRGFDFGLGQPWLHISRDAYRVSITCMLWLRERVCRACGRYGGGFVSKAGQGASSGEFSLLYLPPSLGLPPSFPCSPSLVTCFTSPHNTHNIAPRFTGSS